MNGEVRLGRKEQKRDLSAKRRQTFNPHQQELDRARQTRKRHNKASKAHSATVKDLFFIFEGCGVPTPFEMAKTIKRLVTGVRNDWTTEESVAARIFDPDLKKLTSLPIGLLSEKEEGLPSALLPDSRKELERLCRRMIIRDDNEYLVDLVLAGWPGDARAEDKLQEHVSDLWQLYHCDSRLYGALLCGQHGELILALRQKRLPRDFSSDRIVRMLVRHGLLYCTNDIQLVLARNALAAANPFDALISSDYTRLEPARVVNDLRPYFALLKLLLSLYGTDAELPDDPVATALRARLLHHAEQSDSDLRALAPTLDQTVPYLKRILAQPGGRLRQELAKPVSANDIEKSFHAIWFNGLSNVQASAVPLLRYLQAEAELEREIGTLVPQLGGGVEVREGTALPAFSIKRLAPKWRTRIKDLLDGYREAVLNDADHKRAADQPRSKNAGWKAIEAAMDFLTEAGDRLIPDHQGDPQSKKRTYYLLDIIPEHRLALQKDMLKKGPNGETLVVARI